MVTLDQKILCTFRLSVSPHEEIDLFGCSALNTTGLMLDNTGFAFCLWGSIVNTPYF